MSRKRKREYEQTDLLKPEEEARRGVTDIPAPLTQLPTKIITEGAQKRRSFDNENPTPPPPPPPPIRNIKGGSENPIVVSKTAPLFQIEKQDNVINEMQAVGYMHYETIILPSTAEVLLRFRRI